MEQASRHCHLLLLLTLLLLLQQTQSDAVTTNTTTTGTNLNNNSDERRTVKKDQAPPLMPQDAAAVQEPSAESAAIAAEKVVVISEKPQQAAPGSSMASVAPAAPEAPVGQMGHSSMGGAQPEDEVHIERSNMGKSEDFPETFTAVFYVMVGITSSAILLLIVRIYRLRLSRAERKYGVQGDRANQELTPLPMAIEDVNSDEEEDHTLFEVNRQSIRIL